MRRKTGVMAKFIRKILIGGALLTACISGTVSAAELPDAGEDPNDIWLTEENWQDGMDPFRTSVKQAKPRVQQDNEASGKIVLSPFFDYSKLEATDKATAERYGLASRTGFGFRFQWTQGQSSNFNSRITAGTQSQKFDGPADRRLAEHSPTLWMLGVGAEYLASEWLSLEADVFARHEVFVRRVSPSDLSLDKLVIPQMRLGAKATAYRSGGFSLAFGRSKRITTTSAARRMRPRKCAMEPATAARSRASKISVKLSRSGSRPTT